MGNSPSQRQRISRSSTPQGPSGPSGPSVPSVAQTYNQKKCATNIAAYRTSQGLPANWNPYWENDGSNCYPVAGSDGYQNMVSCRTGQATCAGGDCQDDQAFGQDCVYVLGAPAPISESYDQPCCRPQPYRSIGKTWSEQERYTL
jgi:hypothetical protein